MDIKIAGTANKTNNLSRLKEELQLLEDNRHFAEGELDKSIRRERKDKSNQTIRKLRDSLARMRQQSLSQDPEYQALRQRHDELQKLKEEIMDCHAVWLDKIAQMTGYSNYRGLPLPEQLDQDQWKASVAWTEAHPDSHNDYPGPSPFIQDFGDSDDEPEDEIENQINEKFFAILTGLYPFFDILVEHKTSVKKRDVSDEPTDAGLPLTSVRRIRTDIATIKRSIGLIKAHLSYLKDIMGITEGHATANSLSMLQHSSQVFHGLSSLFSTSPNRDGLDFASLNEYTSSPRRLGRVQKGLKEVERFLSKLELTILLFPMSNLDSSLDSSARIETTDHSNEECEMEMS